MHSLRSVRILSGSRHSLPTSGGQGRALLQSARGPPGGAMGTAEPSGTAAGAARERVRTEAPTWTRPAGRPRETSDTARGSSSSQILSKREGMAGKMSRGEAVQRFVS